MRVVISGTNRDLNKGSRKFNYHKQEKADKNKAYHEKQKKKQLRKDIKQAKISGQPLPQIAPKQAPKQPQKYEWDDYQREIASKQDEEVIIFIFI